MSKDEIDILVKENEILKKRCHMFCHGNWCSLCEMNCEFKHENDKENEADTISNTRRGYIAETRNMLRAKNCNF